MACSSGAAGKEWGSEPRRLFPREMVVIIDAHYILRRFIPKCRTIRHHGIPSEIRLQKSTLTLH